MIKKDVSILISCHKPCKTLQDEIISPIQVGTSLAKIRLTNVLHDNDGENISGKNKRYCELTAQYWAWKNIDAEYYGFFHYRRYLSFADRLFFRKPFFDLKMEEINENDIKKFKLDTESIKDLVHKYDVITPQKTFCVNNYYHYKTAKFHYIKDLNFCLNVIKTDYPEMYSAARKYMRSPFAYFCNMFIMRKDIFNKYCEWLFHILKKHEEAYDCKDYSPQAYRVSGFLAERLCGIYLTWLSQDKSIKMKKLQRIKIKNTNV
ncbi:MAG: DUF4422 domain-containing protein [Clostridia bacterium]|nr:DUF4422 domain-containing protein [Clostridia bacterium]